MPSNSMDAVVFVLSAIAFLYSVIAHEVAHGWVALQCGDDTALHHGRLTANPIPHIDPIWSILVPLMTWVTPFGPFGGAKPVPINPNRFGKWRRDWILVALAGVAVNFLIAAFCAAAIHLQIRFGRTDTLGFHVATRTLFVNVGLIVFNLLPIPPLDGSRVFRFLLDLKARRAYDDFGNWGGPFVIMVVTWLTPVQLLLAGLRRALLTLLGFGS